MGGWILSDTVLAMSRWVSYLLSISYSWSYVKLKTILMCASRDLILSPRCKGFSSDSRSKHSWNKTRQTSLLKAIQICSHALGGQKSKTSLKGILVLCRLCSIWGLQRRIHSLPFRSSKGSCFWLLAAFLIPASVITSFSYCPATRL